MNRRTLNLLACSLLLAVSSFAADVTGKWTAMIPGRNGEQETTFMFKQQGEALSGSMKGAQDEMPIADGKVSGEAISFSVETPRGKVTYGGTISGAEMKLKRIAPEGKGQPREFTAKKSAS